MKRKTFRIGISPGLTIYRFFMTFFVLIVYLYIRNKDKFIYLYFNIHTVCFI